MDNLAERHLGIKTLTFNEVCGKGAGQICFDQVEIERATLYAAEDADVTLQLHAAIYPQIERDPIETYERTLAAEGIDVEAVHASVREELERETEWALAQPMPDPATATDGVFADEVTPLGDGKAPWSRWQEVQGHA